MPTGWALKRARAALAWVQPTVAVGVGSATAVGEVDVVACERDTSVGGNVMVDVGSATG